MESDFKLGDLVLVLYRRTKQLWPAQISKCNFRNVNYRGLFKKRDRSYRQSGRANGQFSPRRKLVERYCVRVINTEVQKWADADDIFTFTPDRIFPLDPICPDFQSHQAATKLALDLYHKRNAENQSRSEFKSNPCLAASMPETSPPQRHPEASETVTDTTSNKTVHISEHLFSCEFARNAGHAIEQPEDPKIDANLVDTAIEKNTLDHVAKKHYPLVPVPNALKRHHDELHVDPANHLVLDFVNPTTEKQASHASPVSLPSLMPNRPEDVETGKDCVHPGARNSCLLRLPLRCPTGAPSTIAAYLDCSFDSRSAPSSVEPQQGPELAKTEGHFWAKGGVHHSVIHQILDAEAMSSWKKFSKPAPNSSINNWHNFAHEGTNIERDVLSCVHLEVQPLSFKPLVHSTAPNLLSIPLTRKPQAIPSLLPPCPSAVKKPSGEDVKNVSDEKHTLGNAKPESLQCPSYIKVQNSERSGLSGRWTAANTKSLLLIEDNTFSQPAGRTEAPISAKNMIVGAVEALTKPAARMRKPNNRRWRAQPSNPAEDGGRVRHKTGPVPATNVTMGQTGSTERTADAALIASTKVEIEEGQTSDETTKVEEKGRTDFSGGNASGLEAKSSSASISRKTFPGGAEDKGVGDTSHASQLAYSPSTLESHVESGGMAGQNAVGAEPKGELKNRSFDTEEMTTTPPSPDERHDAVSIAKDRDVMLGDLVFAKYYNNPYWPAVIVISNWRRSFGKWKREKPKMFFCSFVGPEDSAWVYAKDVQLYNPADVSKFLVPKEHEMHIEQKDVIQAATKQFFARKAKAKKVEYSAPETGASEGSKASGFGAAKVPDFKVGDMVMAKVMGYPYWPGRIDFCPWKEKKFHKKWKMNDPMRVWCLFVDNTGNWVDIEYVKPFTLESTAACVNQTKPDPDQKAAIEIARKLYAKINSNGLGEDDAKTSQRSAQRRRSRKASVEDLRRSKRRRNSQFSSSS